MKRVTIEQLARAFGLNEKTMRRDTQALLLKLVAGFEQVDTEDPEIYALTIRVLIECPDFRKSGDAVDVVARAASAKPALSGSDVGRRARLLPRFKP